MSMRTKMLTQPYGAYHREEVDDTDDELTRVGRGTPCGEYLRRFWQPVGLASELGDLPLRIRILGEDLVLFRDGEGRVGMLELRCSHRGASLEFGKIERRGIRCCYHGWHYDIDGRILDTPGEPVESPIKARLCHGAYPTHEYEGIIFAYMGPPEARPAFPVFDALESPDASYRLKNIHSPCNWLQVRENEMDPAHLTFLHTRLFGTQFTPVYGVVPTMEWTETPIGMLYITVRRWNDCLYLRTNDMILPNIVRVAGIEDAESETAFDRRGSSFNWVVPVDDTNCRCIGFLDIDKSLTLPGHDAYIDRMHAAGQGAVGAGDVGQSGEPSYQERQRAPGDWDAWVSQGPITIHGREHLGFTDRGVAMYRRLLRAAIRGLARGEPPAGLDMHGSGAIKTYCHNTVMRVPGGRDEATERALQLAFGREVTRRVLENEWTKSTRGAAELDLLRGLELALSDRGAASGDEREGADGG